LRLSVRKAWEDDLSTQSAGLSFLTIVALVPLLAAFSHFGARFFSDQPQLIELLAQVMPYTEARINEVLGQFLASAGELTGLAFATFMLTAWTAFSTIESVINRIWDVPKGRALRRRLMSFLLVLTIGPILIGGGYSLLFYLEGDPDSQGTVIATLAQALPYLVTTAALTFLNWQLPTVAVRFRSALSGGLVSATLLELLRHSFGLYVQNATQISVVYGSFGIAILFMISIQVAWFIVLLGTQVAYSVQHFELLSRQRDHLGLSSDWLGLFTMVLMVDRFKRGQPMVPHQWLTTQLGLPTIEVRRVVEPLIALGILREDDGDDGGWLLARDPHEVRVAEILEAYDEPFPEGIGRLPARAAAALSELRDRLHREQRRMLAGVCLSDLVPREPVPEPGPLPTATEPVPEPLQGEAEAKIAEAEAERKAEKAADDKPEVGAPQPSKPEIEDPDPPKQPEVEDPAPPRQPEVEDPAPPAKPEAEPQPPKPEIMEPGSPEPVLAAKGNGAAPAGASPGPASPVAASR
jgi:membrane protein